MTRRRALVPVSLIAAVALVGCARSSTGGESREALARAEAASSTAAANRGSIEALGGRVDDAEGSLAATGSRIDAVEGDVDTVEQGVSDLGGRVDALESGAAGSGGLDEGVRIDDPAAAGFPAGTTPANVEEGLAALNGRVDAQDARATQLETQFNTNLGTAVTQSVQTELANVQIAVDAPDVDFDPDANTTDPRADPGDAAVEYAAAQTVDDAVRALRWAHQVVFNPPVANTNLGNLPRDYVQEAIAALDAVVYDVAQGPYILGFSAASTGNFFDAGLTGWQAATTKCAAAFTAEASPHACTVDEAQQALGAISYDAAALATPTATWTYVPTAGTAANCEGLLNGSGGTGYSLTVELGRLGTDGTGPVLEVASGVACTDSMPVLCCR
jgi:hypothetical protein